LYCSVRFLRHFRLQLFKLLPEFRRHLIQRTIYVLFALLVGGLEAYLPLDNPRVRTGLKRRLKPPSESSPECGPLKPGEAFGTKLVGYGNDVAAFGTSPIRDKPWSCSRPRRYSIFLLRGSNMQSAVPRCFRTDAKTQIFKRKISYRRQLRQQRRKTAADLRSLSSLRSNIRVHPRLSVVNIVPVNRDSLTKARRSWNMSRIRGKHTTPEKVVRSLLRRLGYRFRLHVRIPVPMVGTARRAVRTPQRCSVVKRWVTGVSGHG
jgi:hypothetical protein